MIKRRVVRSTNRNDKKKKDEKEWWEIKDRVRIIINEKLVMKDEYKREEKISEKNRREKKKKNHEKWK